jgi:hypothetical protein
MQPYRAPPPQRQEATEGQIDQEGEMGRHHQNQNQPHPGPQERFHTVKLPLP